ncbi:MAG: sigma-70 family RNA polymerase sigma factor, partial [Lentisphaeraceae bacterium]|nr:sigma-70 family RNA polymerase sigma factor [Lentisphaeraceae bacterium]
VFSEDFFHHTLQSSALDEAMSQENKFAILDQCIDKLPQRQHLLIRQKYLQGLSLKKMEASTSTSENSISQALFRARKNLIECVNKQQLEHE